MEGYVRLAGLVNRKRPAAWPGRSIVP